MDRVRFHRIAVAIFSCACVLPRSAAAQTGPVAAYSFNEGVGTTAADASGNGNTGTLNGATWSTGKFGSGLLFNGATNWVTIPHATLLNLTSAMTLEAW